MSLDAGDTLKKACDAVLSDPSLRPSSGVTHCNQALARIASACGYTAFAGLLADDILAEVVAAPEWEEVSGSDAAIHALSGGLVFAGMSSTRMGEAHGHVAAIYPLGMGRSGSLGHDVPMVANVGKFVGICLSTEAFPVAVGEASYYKLVANKEE